MVVTMGLHSRVDATHEHSMVQYSQLAGHCSVSVRNGGDDHVAHIAQRHRSLQSNGLRRRCSGRVWLEIGAWRRFPSTAKRNVVVRVSWLRHSSILHDIGHARICLSWIFVAGQSRCVDDLRNGFVCFARNSGWLYLGSNLQEFWRRQMEEQCSAYFDALSWVSGTTCFSICGALNEFCFAISEPFSRCSLSWTLCSGAKEVPALFHSALWSHCSLFGSACQFRWHLSALTLDSENE